jgi:hypothetical protein
VTVSAVMMSAPVMLAMAAQSVLRLAIPRAPAPAGLSRDGRHRDPERCDRD